MNRWKTSASDTSHYPKEVPFEVPKGWVWACIGDVFLHNTGKALNAADNNGALLSYITTSNLYWDKFELTSLKTMHFREDEIDKCTAKKGDLLVCEGGDIGRAAIWDHDFDIRIQNHIHKLRGLGHINNRLFMFWMMFLKAEGMIGGKGIGLLGLSSRELDKLIIPIPPIKEQNRLVDKIDDLFTAISGIEDTKRNLSKSISLAKARILDLAIHGKLVPQDPSDEPAIELLKRINPDFKPSDNLHYGDNLPDGWMSCRVDDAFSINPKIQGKDEDDCAFIPMMLIEDGYSNSFKYDVRKWYEIKSGYSRFADGDIVVAKISPCLENRKSAIMHNLPGGYGAGTTELIIFRPKYVIAEYGLVFFKSDWFISHCKGTFSGVVGQQRVDISSVKQISINIPPLEEQKRIVNMVKKVYSFLDTLNDSVK